MTAIERTAYPRLKSHYTPKELEDIFLPSPHDLNFIKQATSENEDLRLGLNCLVQLKCFQHLGYFPALNQVPHTIRQFILDATGSPPPEWGYPSRRTSTRHRAAIRRYLGVMAYRQGGEVIVIQALREAAQTMSDPADLINAAIEELVRRSVELPGFTTLETLTQSIRAEINHSWYQQVMARLIEDDQMRLLSLPTRRHEQSATDFASLKIPPGKPILSEMKRIKDRLQWLMHLVQTPRLLEGIPMARVMQFAAEARSLETDHLRDYTLPHQLTLLTCFLHQVTIETRDHLIEIFLKRMRQIHHQAQDDLDLIRQHQRHLTEQMVRLMGEVAADVEHISDMALLGTAISARMQGPPGAASIRHTCETLSAYDNDNILPLLQPHYTPWRRTLFDMLDLLDIQSTTQDETVVDALQFIKQHQHEKPGLMPADISLEFASQRWRHQVMREQVGRVGYDQRQLELCVFSYVAAELRAGDLAVVASIQYADIRQQMLPWTACQPLIADYCKQFGLPSSGKMLVQHLKHWLEHTAREVDLKFPHNTQLSFNPDGLPTLKRIQARSMPASVKTFQHEVHKRMPQRHLPDILVLTQRLTEFIHAFGPVSGSDPKLTDAAFTHLMTIFAYATNIGPEELARHALDTISARSLAATNRQHVTSSKLDAALVTLINAYSRFDLPAYWGTGRSASADGTLINLYQNNLLSAKHVRYGDYGGIAYYHIADTYIALFSHFISVGVWEAVYIIDGLLKNDSSIQPETLHADTQGQSLPVFGLTWLMGIELMPRIRNWKDLTLYRPSRHTRYQHIDALFTDTIDWDLLRTHWPDLMQVVLSIQQGQLLPSTLLRKLGHHSPKNKLYRAFRELGRVVRTVFLLRFISDEPLQRQVTVATNKVEAYHNFREWIAFGRDSLITTNDPIEWEKRIKYSDLLANALILQNVVDMTRIIHQLLLEGYPVHLNDLAFFSPYWTRHIRRFGTYRLRFDLPPEDILFDIPLSHPASPPLASS